MNGTAVYIVAATIIVVVVVALLSYWTIRQVRKHEVKRRPGVMTRREDGDRSPDIREDSLREASAHDEEQDVDVMDGDRGQSPEVNSGPDWRPEHRPPLVLARSEAEDGMRHLDEDQVVGLSAYETDTGVWDGPEPLAGVAPFDHAAAEKAEQDGSRLSEMAGMSGMEGETAPVDSVSTDDRATGDLLMDELPSSVEPSALAQASGSLAAADFHALLRRRLQHPAVLGWLVVSADGEFRDGDQVYDDRVLELLTALSANARETATTVGLTAPREVVVRGAEGVICVVPAGQIEAGRTESVVVFVEDGGPSPGEVARRLGAQGDAGVDDATTG